MAKKINRKQKKVLVMIFAAVVGAIVGVAVVRYFAFDRIEVVSWKLFWHKFPDIDWGRMGDVITGADTFKKSILGAALGAGAGVAGTKLFGK